MSVYTDPGTGATIRRSRSRRTTEIVQLRIAEHLDEMYLSDLRLLIELAAHLPGDAIVQPREYGVDITYVRVDEDDEHSEDAAPLASDVVDPEVVHELALAFQQRERGDERL